VSDEITFATSGTTGASVTWLRTRDQLATEAELLAQACAAAEVDGVVSYPPPTHLYGYLMAHCLPARLRVPCRPLALTEPATAAFAGLRRPLVAALPASLAHLRRSVAALRGVQRLTLVHSTAATPPGLAEAIAALGVPVRFVELFGSTETGLIASRTGLDTTDWTLAPDVTLDVPREPGTGPRRDRVAARAVPLVVRSPRLGRQPGRARPSRWATGDLVTLTGPGRFRWIGRCGDLIKVNGRPVRIHAVLADLATAAPGVRLSARTERDPVRGERFTVLVHSDNARALAAVREHARMLPAHCAPYAVAPHPEESA
jgi:acyl-coenzyme A synthetase/AMP-(fatty) acid ligase